MAPGTGALVATLMLAAAPLSAQETRTGPRIWVGGGAALDPAFAALTVGADWFVTPALGVGLAGAHTLSGAGDRKAIESGYGFASALVRLRAAPGRLLRTELLAGAGAARTRFGTPGAHTDWDPAAALGAAIGVALPARLELAFEATTQIVLGTRTGSRNPAHTSQVLALVIRFGP